MAASLKKHCKTQKEKKITSGQTTKLLYKNLKIKHMLLDAFKNAH